MRYLGKCLECGAQDTLSSSVTWGRVRCCSCKKVWSGGTKDPDIHAAVFKQKLLLPIATWCGKDQTYIYDECGLDLNRIKVINHFLRMTAARRHNLEIGFEGRAYYLARPGSNDLRIFFEENKVRLWDRSGIERRGSPSGKRLLRWCHEMLRMALLTKLPKFGYAALARPNVMMAKLPEVISEILQAAAPREFIYQKKPYGPLWNPVSRQDEFIWSIVGHMVVDADVK